MSICSVPLIAADAHSRGLAKAQIGGLFDRLVGQRARAGNNADRAAFVDMAGHNADFTSVRCDNARTVRPDQAGFGAFKCAFDAHHVQHRDAFGDADDQCHFSVDCLEDTVGRKGWRHVDHGGVGVGGVHGLVHGIKDR